MPKNSYSENKVDKDFNVNNSTQKKIDWENIDFNMNCPLNKNGNRGSKDMKWFSDPYVDDNYSTEIVDDNIKKNAVENNCKIFLLKN